VNHVVDLLFFEGNTLLSLAATSSSKPHHVIPPAFRRLVFDGNLALFRTEQLRI
jgi:hypothetical protein